MKKLIAVLFAAAVAFSPAASIAQSLHAEQQALTSAGYRFDEAESQWLDSSDAPITAERIAELLPEQTAEVTARLVGGALPETGRESFIEAIKAKIAAGEYSIYLSRPDEEGKVALTGRLASAEAKDGREERVGVDAQLLAHLKALSWDGELKDSVSSSGFMPVSRERERGGSRQSSAPRAEPRREAPRAEPRRETPRAEPRREAPRVETPRRETPKAEPRRETPRVETPRRETPKAEPKQETRTPRVEPKPQLPSRTETKPQAPSKTEPAKTEPAKPQQPRGEARKPGLSEGAKIGAGVAAGAAAGAVIGGAAAEKEKAEKEKQPQQPSQPRSSERNPVVHQKRHTDGSLEKTKRDGTIALEREKNGGKERSERRPDGTKVDEFERGNTRRRETVRPDGLKTKTEVQKGPGREEKREISRFDPKTGRTAVTKIEVDRTGNRTTKHADGRETFRSADGRRVVRTSAQGNLRTEIKRRDDGSTRIITRDGRPYRTINEQRTHTGRTVNRTVIVNNRTVIVNRHYHRRDWYYGGRPYTYYGWYPHYGWHAPVYVSWGWYYNPWVRPIYNPWWGWGWYPYSYWNYYYTPYVAYTAPYLWVTDYLMMDYLAERARERAEARAEARAAAQISQAQIEADSRKAEITPELKEEIAKEVREAMKDIEQKKSPEIESALKPGKPFIVHDEINATDDEENECTLSEGDIVRFVSMNTENEAQPMANVKVAKAKKDSCKAGTEVVITLDDIQEMRNEFYAKIDKGSRQAEQKKKLGCFDDESKAKSEACQAKGGDEADPSAQQK